MNLFWELFRRRAAAPGPASDDERRGSVLFLFLRRMRMPLLVLIGVYAVSITGLVLIPGVDAEGRPWRFDFFHAFYFISYTGSTIGFGEIPYAFSAAQRLWVSICIFLTVIGWLYSIGTILNLLADPGFKRALDENRFARRVARLGTPFYLVCGYGETGSLLVRALCRHGVQPVVVDDDVVRLSRLDLEDLGFDVPWLCAAPGTVRALKLAGVLHPCCRGVVAVSTADAEVIRVALAAKLLNPRLSVMARAEHAATAADLAAAGVDHLIDPYEVFGEHLAMTLRAPSLHMLYEHLVRSPGQPLPPRVAPPQGAWIVCGHGRFGRAACSALASQGVPTAVVEANAEVAPAGAVIGRACEAAALHAAGVERAVGVIAGTDDDAGNLAAVLAARRLKPSLYLIARLNRRADAPLFAAAALDLVIAPSRIIVWRLLAELSYPLANRFLALARARGEGWSREVLDALEALCEGRTPDTWEVCLDEQRAPAVCEALAAGRAVALEVLLREPHDRSQRLPCLPLLRVRGDDEALLPVASMPLARGDRLLFVARAGAARRMDWVLGHNNAFEYALDGVEHPDGYFWRWLVRRRQV